MNASQWPKGVLRHRKGAGSGYEVTHFNNRTQITDEPYRAADLLAWKVADPNAFDLDTLAVETDLQPAHGSLVGLGHQSKVVHA